MSSQGFVGGLMQGYDFMDDRYNRKAQNERLARQEDRQDKRLGMQEEAHEIEKMQRERADEARKIQAVQYKMQNQVPLSEDEQKIVDRYAGDERTQRFMQKVEKDPRKVYSAADSILRGVKGEASKTDVINASNYLFDSWIGQGDGKNKRISDLKPIDGKIYAELEYDDEETGERVTGAPLTYRRKKSDSVVRDLEVGRAAEAAQMMKALAAERIRLGDTGPLEQQAKQQQAQRELGLKLFERGLDREDMAIEHGYDMEKARYEGNVELQKEAVKKAEQALGEMQGYIDQLFEEPVLDEEGNQIMQVDMQGNEVPVTRTNLADKAEFVVFTLQRGHRNWDDSYREFVQVKRQQAQQRQAELRAQQVQEQAQKKVANTEQLIQGGDVQAAKEVLAEYQNQTPKVYQFIMENLSEESRKALQQPAQQQPEKEYTLGKGLQDAKTNLGRVGQKAAGKATGLSDWVDSLNFNWKK
jgi:hypothetical protein